MGLTAYVVGGAVRDRLLGLPIQDRDWVVVGASPDQMLAAGFMPVGKDFPVFLHPTSHEEYALARTERKTAPGYKGFVFHTDAQVTLEEDLIRRDLTINAMALTEAGEVIDPFGGQRDLVARVFRHVSPAFAEDPVRILRLARFAARFPDFSVAPETNALMQQMVNAGEVDHLVPERVWQEISRGLGYVRPSRMIDVLRQCGALARILPEIDSLYGVPQAAEHHPEIDTAVHVLRVLDTAALKGEPVPVRWAALLHDVGKGTSPREAWPQHHDHEARGVALAEAVCERIKVPVDCRDLALLVTREHGHVHHARALDALGLVHLLERVDALRRPERFAMLLAACVCDHQGREGFAGSEHPGVARLQRAREAFAGVDAGAVARAQQNKALIPKAVQAARVVAVQAMLDGASH